MRQKFIAFYTHLPDHKKLAEFITAFLSIPVMATVLIINLNNLNQSKKVLSSTPQSAPPQIIITQLPPATPLPSPTISVSPTSNPTPSPTSSPTPLPTVSPTPTLAPPTPTLIASPPASPQPTSGGGSATPTP